MHFEYFRPLEEMKIVNVAPLHGKLGNERGLLIRPGIPEDSVLLQRMLIRGNNQMPVIGSHLVDENAVKVIRDWIKQLGAAADCTAHD